MAQDRTAPATESEHTVQLKLLGTTDLHGHLCGFDYIADEPEEKIGLTRLASLIQATRQEVPNVLLFDNGDTIQGSPLTDWAEHVRATSPHPMIAALNALKVDAATIALKRK